MQIIHFKKFCVPVSTGISKVDKILKVSPDSISEGVIFQNFPEGNAPQTPIYTVKQMGRNNHEGLF